jgi:hypothetical protein
MQMKLKTYRNDWSAMLEKSGAWYCVNVRNAAGDIHDKVRCDDYRMALDYWRAFNAIAKAGAR